MSDLISRSALIDWAKKQREEVTKKQVAGTDGSIFTREALVTMQRCLSTFENAINNQPTAYDVEAVVEKLDKASYKADCLGATVKYLNFDDTVHIVRAGGKE